MKTRRRKPVEKGSRSAAEPVSGRHTGQLEKGESRRKQMPSVAHPRQAVAQRVITFGKSFTERKDSKTQAKLELLQQTLQKTSNKYLDFLFSDYGGVWIELDDSNDKNPGDATKYYFDAEEKKWMYANMTELRKKKKIAGIGAKINIRKWYFDNYSVGQILAMIAHEVGVHIVPYIDELMLKMPENVQYKYGFDPEKNNPDTDKISGPSGIIDHQRVSNVDEGDFYLYRAFVNDMILGVLKYTKSVNNEEEGQQIAESLGDAYLMDIATFMKSGKRWPVPITPELIARRYNNYMRVEPQLAIPLKKKTGKQVALDYGTLYKRVLPIALKQHYWVTLVLFLGLVYFLAKFFRFL